MDNESNNNYISSRGILKSCDYFSQTPISSIKELYNYPSFNSFINNNNNNNNNPLIYICSSAIPSFIKRMLPHIRFKFILISGDCDEDIPNDIFRTNNDFISFVDDDRLLHWYCQNWIGEHKKVSNIPIGMDYHTMQTRDHFWGPKTNCYTQELLLNKIRETMKPFWERDVKCYSNFHFFTTTKHGYDRIEAIKNIPNELVYYEPERIKRLISWKKQSNYAFVISPHGGGYDCHRTWEALLLGCIVIVKKSKIDKLYEELPVLIVDKWSDVNIDLLKKTIIDFKNKKFNYDKLNLSYWIKNIKNNHNNSRK
jgi:hypothetical protein